MDSRIRLLPAAAVALTALAAACTDKAGPTPGISGIAPETVFETQLDAGDGTLAVTGEGFTQRVIPDTRDPSASRVANPQVFLGTIGLVTSYGGPNLLTAIVPSTLAPGAYDVVVVNPDGASATYQSYVVRGMAETIEFGSRTEAPGTSNEVAIPWLLRDASGATAPFGADTTFDILLSTTAATAVPPSVSVTALGETAGTITISYVKVGTVTVEADLTTSLHGDAVFVAGTAAMLRLLGHAPGPVNVAQSTTLQLEDAWENLVPADVNLDVTLLVGNGPSCGSPCTSSTVDGQATAASVTLLANDSSLGVAVNCPIDTGCTQVRVLGPALATTGSVFVFE